MKRLVFIKLNVKTVNHTNIGRTGRTFLDRYKEHVKAIINQSRFNYANQLIKENHSY